MKVQVQTETVVKPKYPVVLELEDEVEVKLVIEALSEITSYSKSQELNYKLLLGLDEWRVVDKTSGLWNALNNKVFQTFGYGYDDGGMWHDYEGSQGRRT